MKKRGALERWRGVASEPALFCSVAEKVGRGDQDKAEKPMFNMLFVVVAEKVGRGRQAGELPTGDSWKGGETRPGVDGDVLSLGRWGGGARGRPHARSDEPPVLVMAGEMARGGQRRLSDVWRSLNGWGGGARLPALSDDRWRGGEEWPIYWTGGEESPEPNCGGYGDRWKDGEESQPQAFAVLGWRGARTKAPIWGSGQDHELSLEGWGGDEPAPSWQQEVW